MTELTKSELAILSSLSRGSLIREVADELHVSPRSVGRDVRRVCERLGVARRVEAVVWAVRRDLI